MHFLAIYAHIYDVTLLDTLPPTHSTPLCQMRYWTQDLVQFEATLIHLVLITYDPSFTLRKIKRNLTDMALMGGRRKANRGSSDVPCPTTPCQLQDPANKPALYHSAAGQLIPAFNPATVQPMRDCHKSPNEKP